MIFNVVSGELIVSSEDEITRERLEAEATLLDSVMVDTECEAVTEREDTYEVIIDSEGERRPEQYSIGAQLLHITATKEKMSSMQLFVSFCYTMQS